MGAAGGPVAPGATVAVAALAAARAGDAERAVLARGGAGDGGVTFRGDDRPESIFAPGMPTICREAPAGRGDACALATEESEECDLGVAAATRPQPGGTGGRPGATGGRADANGSRGEPTRGDDAASEVAVEALLVPVPILGPAEKADLAGRDATPRCPIELVDV
eukprot:NODE_15308_length_1057_cov_2.747312.p3 GENE.NODE_15308_length_1057_cov_2.747312~~NODE_15308_length_1057_cov_2.747312.p3  ORF type:complete len:165 (+),score=36.70 NODE_15308_length_1057_cov_2.747312:527-1021(+)